MTISRQALFAGRVQGVGFRYTVKQIAAGYEVTGWVRNLPDGHVELQAAGQAAEIDAFLRAIADSHLKTHIKETWQTDVQPQEPLWTGFEIHG